VWPFATYSPWLTDAAFQRVYDEIKHHTLDNVEDDQQILLVRRIHKLDSTLGQRIFLLAPVPYSAVHGNHVLVTHLLQVVGSQS
jgi:hypothetical protein